MLFRSYRYHEIGHFWRDGAEQWRQLVYMIGTIREKYRFLGEDVYKRQKENSKIKEGVRIDETVTRIFKGASLCYDPCTIISVSYTHLDVYKRQAKEYAL